MTRKKNQRRRWSKLATEMLESRIVLNADVSLFVFVESEQVEIPVDIGVDSGGNALAQITTTDDSGTIRVEALAGESVDDLTLGDFFDTWQSNAGVAGNNPDATLSDNQIFGSTVDATNTLQMFVNGELSTEFDEYVLQDQDRIVLVYGDNPVVSLNTNFGSLVFELFEDEAPATVDNFLNYLNRGDFVGSFFHRSVTDFVIQGGGFATTSNTFTSTAQFSRIPTDPPVQNEPGFENLRGTVAMAKTSDPDSATNQFFVNLSDANTFLDNPSNSGGFTVFAQSLDMGVADAINDLEIRGGNDAPYGELPLGENETLVVIESVAGRGVVSGTKFFDSDSNGLFDSSEQPAANAVVFVDDNNNGQLDAGEVSTTTDNEGRYRFDLVPGTYTIATEITNAGSASTAPASATYTANVQVGRELADNDFGEEAPLVAEDDSFSAVNNVPETRLDVLANDTLPAGTTIDSVSDGSAGGQITVDGNNLIYTPSAGFVGSETFTYSLAAPDARTATASVTIDVDQAVSGEVSGVVYIDLDVDGEQDNNEVGVPGTQVTLAGPADDGTTVELTEITANDGSYLFTDVPPGTYTLTQQQPAALVNGEVEDEDGNMDAASNELVDVVVTSGETVSDNDFVEGGLADGFASIIWFFASSGSPEVAFREAVAMGEEGAGNVELADAIRSESPDTVLPEDPTDPDDPNTDVDAPIAVNDSFTVVEDGELSLAGADGVLANDTDPNNETLTATVETTVSNGSLFLGTDGSVDYVPNADFSGTDSFTYTLSNGTSTDTATATIVVTPVDDTIEAVNDVFTLNEDEVFTANATDGVLANDIDPDNDITSTSVSVAPVTGNLVLNDDGSLTYTPSLNFAGTDSFTYEIIDAAGSSSAATATLEIRPVNDPPTVVNDSYSTSEGLVLNVSAANGLLANDSDVESNPLTAVVRSQPSNGVLALNTDGSFTYTPNSGFSGTDQFRYGADDGSDETEGTVTIVVDSSIGENDETYTVNEDASLIVNAAQGVLANDPGANEATLITAPAAGTLNLASDGSFEYTPPGNFSGLATFTYEASDGASNTTTSTASITVVEVNDAPVAVDDSFSVNEDETLAVDAAGGVRPNDSDVDDSSLTAALIQPAGNGTVFLQPDGSFTYNPNTDFFGEDTFVYAVSDGSLTSNNATVTITVDGVNDAPNTQPDSYVVNAGETLFVNDFEGVLVNDSDLENDTLTASISANPQSGSALLQTNGSFSYTPNSGFSGTDAFEYIASDGSDVSVATIVTIEVNPSNILSVAADVASGTVVGQIQPTGNFDSPTIFQIDEPEVDDRLQINADDHVSGEPTSPVVLIEYLDFECPACAAFHPVVGQLEETFEDDLFVVRRHLPLESVHEHAREAALSAEAAEVQQEGGFEAMGDLLFENQADWENAGDATPIFEGYAQQLGLDLVQFRNDVASASLDAGITEDFNNALALGATATPSFFLQNERLSPNPSSLEDFQQLIQTEVDAASQPFGIDRSTGEIVVLNASAIVPSSTVTIPVIVKDLDNTEQLDVIINVGDLSSGGTSSTALVDDALATEDDWLA